jgi:hypothetical protein
MAEPCGEPDDTDVWRPRGGERGEVFSYVMRYRETETWVGPPSGTRRVGQGSVTKTLRFRQKRSPNCDFYGPSILSTP